MTTPTYTPPTDRTPIPSNSWRTAVHVYQAWARIGDIDRVPTLEEAEHLYMSLPLEVRRRWGAKRKYRAEKIVRYLTDRYSYSPIADLVAVERAATGLRQVDLDRLNLLEWRMLGELIVARPDDLALPRGNAYGYTRKGEDVSASVESPRRDAWNRLDVRARVRVTSVTEQAYRVRKLGLPTMTETYGMVEL